MTIDNTTGRTDYSDPSTLGQNTDGLGRDRTDDVTRDETGKLISADKVQGTAVYNTAGERLGTIDSIMLNKRSGEVAYAVMSFGGFLGIGERYHPLPWDVLDYDTAQGGYCVNMDKNQLSGAPNYSRDELSSFDFDRRGGEIDSYYGDEFRTEGRRSWRDDGDEVGSTGAMGGRGTGSSVGTAGGMTSGSAAGAVDPTTRQGGMRDDGYTTSGQGSQQSSTMPSSGIGNPGGRGGTNI